MELVILIIFGSAGFFIFKKYKENLLERAKEKTKNIINSRYPEGRKLLSSLDKAKSADDILNITSTILAELQAARCLKEHSIELIDDFNNVVAKSKYGDFDDAKWRRLIKPLTKRSSSEVISCFYIIFDKLVSIGIPEQEIDIMLGVVIDTAEDLIVDELYYKVSSLDE